MDKTQIRNASTVILVRETSQGRAILMGQRGSNAAFMPNKFVFPGGAVDEADHDIPLATQLNQTCSDRLANTKGGASPSAMAVAAIRELWEETGLTLSAGKDWSDPPPAWEPFSPEGQMPSAETLKFAFRAITPPGRPRRFDARFFIANAESIDSDLDDFSAATDELSHLQWVNLDNAKSLDLPFITQVVLAEVSRLGDISEPPAAVPFFNYRTETPEITYID